MTRSCARRAAMLAVLLGPAWFSGPAQAYTVYVSNEKDDTITVIDSKSLQVTRTVKVGRRPRGVILSKDGKFLYVCASDDNGIEVIDVATLKVVRTLKSGPDPELFILHPSGNPLYIANEDDNQITVLDVEQNKILAEVPVGVEPEGMGISPDGKILVNTSETTNMAHFIDTSTYKVVDSVLVDARPRYAEFSADGKFLWVSSEVGGTVSVIDAATRRIIKKIEFKIPGVPAEAVQPVGIRLTRDGKRAFVALGPANRVAVDQRARRSRWRSIFSSGSASGSLPSRPTRSFCSRRTVPRATCRSSTSAI